MNGAIGTVELGLGAIGKAVIAKGYFGNKLIYSAGNMVTYHVDIDEMYQEEVESDETVLEPKTFVPEKDGWEFVGWKEDTTSDDNVIEELVMDDNPIDLYAIFQQAISLSYNGNGNNSGSVDSESKYRYYNNGVFLNPVFTVKQNSFVKTSYTFVQWRLDDINGTAYSPNSLITLEKDSVLYAQWRAADRSLITSGWVLSGSGGYAVASSSSSQVRLQLPPESGSDLSNTGKTRSMDSPTFDITPYKTLSVAGSAYKSAYQAGYHVSVYLIVGSQTITLFTLNQLGSTTSAINVTRDVSTLSGSSKLRIAIHGYDEDHGLYNADAYIILTKALLTG